MLYDLIFTFFTLTFLEIILGIDNLIFIAIVVQKLPKRLQKSARIFGLSLAFIIRVLMLLMLSWVMTLTQSLFSVGALDISFKDLLMIFGGLFLLFKSSLEIIADFRQHIDNGKKEKEIKVSQSFLSAALQIALVDLVFSFDSVITAIAMSSNVPIIVAAVLIGVLIMFFASGFISEFLEKYPSLKIIALAFIFMVGVILIADGVHAHIAKGYLYFSLFFTLSVESINIVLRKKELKKN